MCIRDRSRTNLIKQTEYFGDSQWLVDGVSLDANNITSPEGLQNAYKITDDTTTGYHLITDSDVFLADGVMRTWSVFVKKGTARYCVIGAGNQFVVQDNALIFDMEGGTYTSTGTSSFFDTIHDPINMGNGWYRIGFSSDLNSSSYNKLSIGVSQGATWSGNVSYTGDGSLNYYIFGAQVEQGSYPTSYIPNHSGGSVTREAESITQATSSFNIRGDYTFFFEVSRMVGYDSGNTPFITLNNTTDNSVLYFYNRDADKNIRFLIREGSTGGDSIYSPNDSFEIGERVKFCIRKDSTKTEVFFNGSSIGSTTNHKPDGFDNILNGFRLITMHQNLVFSSALPDNQCIALTS